MLFTSSLIRSSTAACVTLLLGLGVTHLSATAQESGRVISRTPVIQQVAVPRQVCTNTQVATQGQKSGAGALMGAIAGGTVGNNIGSGSGRTAATMLGVFGGAI
ncbi:MAG: glycine zipper 2TM domain-containing protein, partial [Burkholderiaceae bacterium]